MARLSLNLPAMYGDHHVLEVRRILLALPGIDEILASSCFCVVEVSYDPTQTNEKMIIATLEAAGYFNDWEVPAETGAPVYGIKSNSIPLRHTVAYQQTRKMIGFAHNLPDSGRALWPCPGMGVIQNRDEEGE